MPANYRLSILLMAAGASKRFNGIKQLARVGSTSLLQRTIDEVRQLDYHQTVLVLGNAADEIVQHILLAEDMQIAQVRAWPQGLGSSIAEACNDVSEHCSHVLIVLADQVALAKQHFEQLITQSREYPERIICGVYQQRAGVPAIFPRVFLPRLKAMSGDQGAKAIIENERYISVSLPEAAYDIDTQEQLENWQQAIQDQR